MLRFFLTILSRLTVASGLVQVDFANADDEEEEVGEAVDDAEQEEETSTEGAD